MGTIKKLIQFIKDSYNEFKKVSWPTRRAVYDSTIGVIVAIIALVVLFAVFDEGIGYLMGFLVN